MLQKTSTLLALLTASIAAIPYLRGEAPAACEVSPLPAAMVAETESHPLTFMTGHWIGEGLGGVVEEVWTAPRAGVMMAMFRSITKGRTAFYELVTVQEGRDGWEMRLRHFHSDLVAWEEKTKPLVWPMSHSDESSAVFGPVTYELDGPDKLVAYVELDEGKEPAVLRFSRADSTTGKVSTASGAR